MSYRTYERIFSSNLKRLSVLVATERSEFFARHIEARKTYADKLITTILVGDAALHFLNGNSGFIDFHLITLYSKTKGSRFPFKGISYLDYGFSKFGKTPNKNVYRGRRIALRSICISGSVDQPIESTQQFIIKNRLGSADKIKKKAAIVIEPRVFLGYIAWPSLAR